MFFSTCVRHTSKFSKIINKTKSFYLKMADEALLTRIRNNNAQAEKEIAFLKEQMKEIQELSVNNEIAKLRTENSKLSQEVTKLLNQLRTLEIAKGIPQIPVPGQTVHIEAPKETKPAPVQEPAAPAKETKPVPEVAVTKDPENKPAKDKKKDKAPATPKAPKEAAPEPDIDVGRLDFRVGKIVEVSKHPDADSLYVEKVDCGEPNPRTVVSGLVKFVPLEEMQNRMVVLLCNLKPAKMRGVLSEAMVMCASTPEKVEVLSPPEGSAPGDLVHCEGFPRQPDAQLNPKKKIFETCAPDLQTNESLIACYKGKALHVPGKGNVVSKTLKNVNVK